MAIGGDLRFLVVGEGPLAVAVIERLVDRGRVVVATASAFDEVTIASHALGLPHVGFGELSAAAHRLDHDVLLNVVNHRVIPQSVRDRTARIALNYHDSLLPEHAGYNATSWAILGGDKRHGATWHELVGALDSGPIVAQAEFAVGATDDALVLDTRCFEAGLASFDEVLAGLESGSLRSRVQDRSKRTFHPLQDSPPNAEWIDWRDDARAIERLVRALGTGTSRSRVGPAIARSATGVLLASEPSVTDRVDGLPGDVLAIDGERVEVRAGDRAIRLRLVEAPTTFSSAGPHLLRPGDSLLSPPGGDAEVSRRSELAEARAMAQLRDTVRDRVVDDGLDNDDTSPFEFRVDASVLTPLTRAGSDVRAWIIAAWSSVSSSLGLPLPELWKRRAGDLDVDTGWVPVSTDMPHDVSVRIGTGDLARRLAEPEVRIPRHAIWRDASLERRVGRRPVTFMTTEDALPELPLTPQASVVVDERGVRGWATASAFGSSGVGSFWTRVETWLRNAVSDEDRRIGTIECLNDDEVAAYEALDRTSAGTRGNPVTTALHRQLTVAHRNPAVVGTGFEMTYERLASMTAAVQTALAGAGVRQGQTVAVRLGRGQWLLPSIVAVMLSGCVWVAVEPRHPLERQRRIIDVADAAVVLEDGDGPTRDGRTIDVRSLREHPTDVVRLVDFHHDADAYKIFTSGTTGHPKGIAIGHRALANHMEWMLGQFPISPEDRFLQRSNLTFDAAIIEFLSPLMSGATVVLASDDEQNDPEQLVEVLDRFEVTALQTPPTLLRMLIDVDRFANDLPRLRRLFVGGERFDGDTAAAVVSREALDVVNLYGPSETTIDAFAHQVQDADVAAWSVPIGRPIDGMGATVVDANGRRRPFGVPGSLVLHGAGLGRYVTNDDGFSGTGDERHYVTGDVVEMDATGIVQHLGRVDDQVKVRGHRVELDEVRSAISGIDGVRTYAVFAGSGDTAGAIVAAVVSNSNDADPMSIRQALITVLPAAAVPSRIVVLPRLPMTTHGKVDERSILRMLEPSRPTSESTETPAGSIIRIIGEVLSQPAITESDGIFDIGGSSVDLVRIKQRVKTELGVDAPVSTFFRARTIGALVSALTAPDSPPSRPPLDASSCPPPDKSNNGGRAETRFEPIAVVGMSGRFPGAPDIGSLWTALLEGRELIEVAPGDESTDHPHNVQAIVDTARSSAFDGEFFGLSPASARRIDPQQRAFLEVAWHALEDAGVRTDLDGETTGVFASSGYPAAMMQWSGGGTRRPLLGGTLDDFDVLVASDKDFIAPRTSYLLDLGGPSITVQSACSSSLVAVHLAVQSLRLGECDVAVAGGSSLRTDSATEYRYEPGGVVSPDGRCRPFSAHANGTVFSSATAAVVLKPLGAARLAGDRVYGVIVGSSVVNDGSQKLGFTAPSADGHARAIRRAVADAGITAEEVRYVEAHGTGTVLGDPVEIDGIASGLGRTDPTAVDRCLVGSIKGNIGHTDAAAGIVSLIKAVLAVQNATIPASVNAAELNPLLRLEATSLEIAQQNTPWEGPIRTAGVSSLGVGGTNAHVILQSLPDAPHAATGEPEASRQRGAPEDSEPQEELFVASAASPAALRSLSAAIERAADSAGSAAAAPLAASLRTRRTPLRHRSFWFRGSAEGRPTIDSETSRNRPLLLLFSGQGGQDASMGSWLYGSDESFRAAYDEAVSYAPLPPERVRPGASLALTDHVSIHVRVFASQYATAVSLRNQGIVPDLVLGHSLGEIAAATIAGAIGLEDAVRLVTARGRAVRSSPPGHLLALRAERPFDDDATPPGTWLAADNSPVDRVLAGSRTALDDAIRHFAGQGVAARWVPGNRAFHSPALDGASRTLADLVIDAHPSSDGPTLLSSSDPASRSVVPDAAYWAAQIVRPVRFREALDAVTTAPIVLEIGPGRALSSFVRHRSDMDGLPISVLDAGGSLSEQRASALSTLGHLWARGLPVDWKSAPGAVGLDQVAAPAYPFEDSFAAAGEGTDVTNPTVPTVPTVSTVQWSSVQDDLVIDRRACVHHVVGVLSVAEEQARLERAVHDRRDPVLLDFSGVIAAIDATELLPLALAVLDVLRTPAAERDVIIAAAEAFDVIGTERVRPSSRMLASMVSALREAGGLGSIRYCDLGPDLELTDSIADAVVRADDAILAVRGERIWRPTEVPVPIPVAPEPRATVVEDPSLENWLVFGGSGAIGRVLVDDLLQRGRRVVVASRTPGSFSPAMGATVSRCDVTDEAAVESLLRERRAAGQPITHIVHAAGTTWDEAEIEPANWDIARAPRIIDAKKTGADVLARVTDRAPEVERVILFSSIATVEGTGGQVAYAAGNGYLDGVAERAASKKWLSVAWDVWAISATTGLDTVGALNVLHQLTSRSGYVRVRAEQFVEPRRRLQDQHQRAAGEDDAATSPAGSVTRRVADIVEEVLGSRPASDASLRALGSDSFAATRIGARVRQVFGFEVPLRALLRADSVDAITTVVVEHVDDDGPR